ncbi:MAG: DNA repair protein RecO [Lachnospiraceae bacterium]|nr:DNA repair protein RecO [Lachnospiraceae bacterium]
MGETYTVTGMVIAAQPVGEYDKRIVILTREKGKISAFAKGARRPGNAQMAGSRPFSFGEFDLFEGKSSYTVEAMRIKNYFEELSNDLEGTMYGYYFMEFAGYYAKENIDGTEMIKLLYQSFRALLKESLPNELIRRIFELKLMTINGEYPNVFSCMICNEEKNFRYFDFEKNGFICDECAGNNHVGAVMITEATAYTLQYIITATIEKLYTFTLKEEVLRELGQIIDKEIKRFVDRKMNSLEILQGFIT